jgi:hypothetical protein
MKLDSLDNLNAMVTFYQSQEDERKRLIVDRIKKSATWCSI